jgi:hypothetical protein
LVFLVLVFAASEFALRYRYETIGRITGAVPWTLSEWKGLTYFWDRYDARLGWTNQPGYKSDERVPFEVTINAQGLRGSRDYASTPPPGVSRIAVFGDSTVFGEEVDDAFTIPVFLERSLQNVEVLNYGVRGYGLGQMTLRLEEPGLQLNPDYVVPVILVPEDLARTPVMYFFHPKPSFVLGAAGGLEVQNLPVPEGSDIPWLYRRVFTAGWLWSRLKNIELSRRDSEELLEIAELLLRRAQVASEARQARFMPVLLTGPAMLGLMERDGDYRAAIAYYLHTLTRFRGEAVDLIPAQSDFFRREGLSLAMPFGHWTPRGNCLIAAELAQQLASTTELELAANVSCAK